MMGIRQKLKGYIGHMIHYQGYLWEITYKLVAHYGTFYFLKRREGNRIIMQEVEEGLLTAQIMVQSTEEVNNE